MRSAEERVPYLAENLWGYGKRLCFVDGALQRAHPGKTRGQLSVLDIGCGNGSQLAIPLALAGYQVTAVDPHEPSIERGRRLSSAVRFLHGTVDMLPMQAFDCIALCEVLEHLSEPEELLQLALPYLAPRGLLVVSVPNGFGEFEIDRAIYTMLQLDRLVAWLKFRKHTSERKQSVAGSDSESPHVQRFTLSKLHAIFARLDLQVFEARATSLLSGPMIAHSFARFETFVRLNAAIADAVPLVLASGWMFLLRPASDISHVCSAAACG